MEKHIITPVKLKRLARQIIHRVSVKTSQFNLFIEVLRAKIR